MKCDVVSQSVVEVASTTNRSKRRLRFARGVETRTFSKQDPPVSVGKQKRFCINKTFPHGIMRPKETYEQTIPQSKSNQEMTVQQNMLSILKPNVNKYYQRKSENYKQKSEKYKQKSEKNSSDVNKIVSIRIVSVTDL